MIPISDPLDLRLYSVFDCWDIRGKDGKDEGGGGRGTAQSFFVFGRVFEEVDEENHPSLNSCVSLGLVASFTVSGR